MTLLDDVKNQLDITWIDPQTDKKVAGIIERGKKYLNIVAGNELDFEIEDKPKELLIEYVRYARSGALNEYATNYQHELLLLQIMQEVKSYAATDV